MVLHGKQVTWHLTLDPACLRRHTTKNKCFLNYISWGYFGTLPLFKNIHSSLFQKSFSPWTVHSVSFRLEAKESKKF